jgi:predicted transposase YdaD
MMPVNYLFRREVAEKTREERREEGRKEGRVEGRAEMVQRILEWRDIDVPDAARGRVASCSDLEQLTLWAKRAMRVTDAWDLFTDDAV